MNKKSRLILVDGSAYIFRAYYGLPPMNRSDGTPINAVFGFTNMLVKLIEDYSNDKMIVIFDAARENFRNNIYPEYKDVYMNLVEAKILFLDKKKLTSHINENWQNLDEWWNSKKTQKYLNNFNSKLNIKPTKNYINNFITHYFSINLIFCMVKKA